MLHRWHLSHHKNDGKCTMEIFKTKDNKGSPSWEVQYRPWAPSWDITLLVSSRSLGLKSHCRFESLWLLNQQAELRRGLYAYNLDADLCRKTSQTSPEGQVWTTGEKTGAHTLYTQTGASVQQSQLHCHAFCLPHILGSGEVETFQQIDSDRVRTRAQLFLLKIPFVSTTTSCLFELQ